MNDSVDGHEYPLLLAPEGNEGGISVRKEDSVRVFLEVGTQGVSSWFRAQTGVMMILIMACIYAKLRSFHLYLYLCSSLVTMATLPD